MTYESWVWIYKKRTSSNFFAESFKNLWEILEHSELILHHVLMEANSATNLWFLYSRSLHTIMKFSKSDNASEHFFISEKKKTYSATNSHFICGLKYKTWSYAFCGDFFYGLFVDKKLPLPAAIKTQWTFAVRNICGMKYLQVLNLYVGTRHALSVNPGIVAAIILLW